MQENLPNLYIEINIYEFIFFVGKNNENNQFEALYKKAVSIEGVIHNKITDPKIIQNIIKKNIFEIEQKLKFVFKEAILIIDNFECLTNNISGYKKLNGSQLVRENITLENLSIKKDRLNKIVATYKKYKPLSENKHKEVIKGVLKGLYKK